MKCPKCGFPVINEKDFITKSGKYGIYYVCPHGCNISNKEYNKWLFINSNKGEWQNGFEIKK